MGPMMVERILKIFNSKIGDSQDIAIQISTEKDWKGKIVKEAEKIKKNYRIKSIIFVSSRRIPENTFQKLATEMLKEIGISITRYDNQAISSEFILNNRVEKYS